MLIRVLLIFFLTVGVAIGQSLHGVPQDYAEAVSWFRKAAEQGSANAQYNLGQMYRQGQGVPRDYAEAVKWHRLAAEPERPQQDPFAGDSIAGARINLGVAYSRGQGVPQDYAEALKWYRLAAEQGNAGAQFKLGLMYDQGEGVPRDYPEALNVPPQLEMENSVPPLS